jgi:hypothetical protein
VAGPTGVPSDGELKLSALGKPRRPAEPHL